MQLDCAGMPDALVITSGMLGPSPRDNRRCASGRRPASIRQPILLVDPAKDGCRYTPAASAAKAKALCSRAKTVEITILQGGSAGRGDPCEAHAHHGFEARMVTWSRQ